MGEYNEPRSDHGVVDCSEGTSDREWTNGRERISGRVSVSVDPEG